MEHLKEKLMCYELDVMKFVRLVGVADQNVIK